MKKLVIGILAHVDAGKTTLSEGMLYECGKIRKLGRVDHKDAYLDTYELERERGITIFSKQAVLDMEDLQITLMDTPGHIDFSAEMERTLQILDYAILVISGADGVQGHTMTLWKLLRQYRIPTFLFVNKMDQPDVDRESLLEELKKRLDANCIDFDSNQSDDVFMENVAACDESLMEQYFETNAVDEEEIRRCISQRILFPCFFGSALKMTGVTEFLQGIKKYTQIPQYKEKFGAKVFKIARDEQGNRLTYLKVTGGSLKVKEILTNRRPDRDFAIRHGQPEEIWEEKADQIRIYSGAKFELEKEAAAGTVCAVTGLTQTYPGQGLGAESESELPLLEPVLNYEIKLPPECDVHQMLKKLKQIEEEEPQLHIVWDEHLGEIHAMLMGEVQIEILKHMIWERFKVAVEFGSGSIVYKETIAEPVEGVGHFEPLRHYAEVHLMLEPGEPGSGLQFFTSCSEDALSRNWQRLILTHLEEKEHIGVLTGSPITDMQITLISGKAHLKHTEGGDFRQATYRAIRQGLKKAKSVLLEPYYEFRMEIPTEMSGRAISDIQRMQGTFLPPEMDEDMSVIRGTAPVSAMRDYQKEVLAYTGGRGRLFCELGGYQPCSEQDAVVETIGYDSERDLLNPTGSVFCAHGAGFVVPWNQVEEYMHLEGAQLDSDSTEVEVQEMNSGRSSRSSGMGSYEEDKELQAIFERTFGPVKRQRFTERKTYQSSSTPTKSTRKKANTQEEYLLIDGYNIIYAWPELRELASDDLHAAQTRLIDIMSNYQGYTGMNLILVFDAYKIEGHAEEVLKYHNIYVVYTKEAETADQYIEKTVHKLSKDYKVTVATSDGLEQVIIMGQGALRMSARDLKEDLELRKQQTMTEWKERRQSSKSYLFDNLSDELSDYVEDIRLGKKKQ
ncbi:MAG: TetM/TetW/TetO/TetS family tetracycline resistance ribosomal protection protein [Eubacteriales bacterium]|nr:TetM/TetW/TetO/TetS family tetracycline resistance ribosomal protection protein [Eubacteriales bacterium]